MIIVGNRREGEVCPSCSVERDKGGRLVKRVRAKSFYLRCSVCRYSVTHSKVSDKDAVFRKKHNDLKLFATKSPFYKKRAKQMKEIEEKARAQLSKGLLG